jgi:hypothetical protein
VRYSPVTRCDRLELLTAQGGGCKRLVLIPIGGVLCIFLNLVQQGVFILIQDAHTSPELLSRRLFHGLEILLGKIHQHDSFAVHLVLWEEQ